MLILLLTLSTALLVFTLFHLPLLWTSDLHLLQRCVAGDFTLLGLALVGGYLQGREQVVRNAIKSAVVAAKRQQQQQERAQSEQTRLELERERTEQARLHTEQMRLHSELEQERLALERLRIERDESPPPTLPTPVPFDWNMPTLEAVDSPNGESTSVRSLRSFSGLCRRSHTRLQRQRAVQQRIANISRR